eukprot:scaffold16497_cov67-Phaeocystis_antarctica.AAC.3
MGLCEHGRRLRQSDECGSASICKHGRQRYLCKNCGGKGICPVVVTRGDAARARSAAAAAVKPLNSTTLLECFPLQLALRMRGAVPLDHAEPLTRGLHIGSAQVRGKTSVVNVGNGLRAQKPPDGAGNGLLDFDSGGVSRLAGRVHQAVAFAEQCRRLKFRHVVI